MATTVEGETELRKIAREMSEKAKTLFVDLARPALQAAEIAAGELRIASNEMFSHRTGELARSWRPMFLRVSRSELTTAALSDLVYAAIQNDGGTIVPRTRKYLAIPLVDLPVGKWPRDFGRGELSFVPLKSGDGGLLVRAAKGKARQGKIGEAIFLLKKSVTLKGRHYIEKAAAIAEPRIQEHMAQAAAKSLEVK